MKTPNHNGTCQCCFASYKVRKGGYVTHHGFKRPGIGFLVGVCRGTYELPYEKSCEATKTYRQECEAYIKVQSELLQKYQNNEINEIVYIKELKEVVFDMQGRSKHKTTPVTVLKGTPEKGYVYRPYDTDYTPSFEQLREDKIRKISRDIEVTKQEVIFLTEKINQWKLVELAP